MLREQVDGLRVAQRHGNRVTATIQFGGDEVFARQVRGVLVRVGNCHL
jgi:hypothetical protein